MNELPKIGPNGLPPIKVPPTEPSNTKSRSPIGRSVSRKTLSTNKIPESPTTPDKVDISSKKLPTLNTTSRKILGTPNRNPSPTISIIANIAKTVLPSIVSEATPEKIANENEIRLETEMKAAAVRSLLIPKAPTQPKTKSDYQTQLMGTTPTSLPKDEAGTILFSQVGANNTKQGTEFILDSDLVINQRVLVQKYKATDANGKEKQCVEFQFQRRPIDLRGSIDQGPGRGSKFRFVMENGKEIECGPAKTLKDKNGQWEIQTAKTKEDEKDLKIYRAIEGMVIIRIFGSTDKELTKNFNNALEASNENIKNCFKEGDPTAFEVSAKMALLDSVNPRAARKLREMVPNPTNGKTSIGPYNMTLANIDAKLKEAGITPDEIKGLQRKEVVPGYSCFFSQKQADLYTKEYGVEYAFTGVRNVNSVVAICQSEITSTKRRWGTLRLPIKGASSITDVKKGGGKYGYFRWVTQVAVNEEKGLGHKFEGVPFGSSNAYKLIIDQEVFGRLDAFGYSSDKFGQTGTPDYHARKCRRDLVDDINNATLSDGPKYTHGNEYMLEEAVNKSSIRCIICPTKEMKRDLILAFREQNIREINGIRIEKFLLVEDRMKSYDSLMKRVHSEKQETLNELAEESTVDEALPSRVQSPKELSEESDVDEGEDAPDDVQCEV